MLLRLLTPLVALCTFTLLTGARASASPEPPDTTTTTTPPPSESFAPNFSEWTPCSDADSLTRSEWANCSTAYNTDRMRERTTSILFVLLAFVVATFLLAAFRR